jgi:fucose permease
VTVRGTARHFAQAADGARLGTYAAFAGAGISFSAWLSRIPQVQHRLDLRPGQLGLVLLALSMGSVIALPSAGGLVARFGSRRTVTFAALLQATALILAGCAYQISGVVLLVVALFLFGMAAGAWDVAMNVQGATVERRQGRSIMARFHASYSMGMVGGAVLGASLIALGCPVSVHLIGMGAIIAVGVPLATRRFVPGITAGPARGRGHGLEAWREPGTVLIGLMVLAFSFAEGAGNDWIGVALVHGQHTSTAVGTVGFACFVGLLTLTRWLCGPVINRFGRVAVTRSLACIGLAGVLIFVFGPDPAVALAGAALWGGGVAPGFPVAMSAAASDPSSLASRVSVISSIGYCAFLAGPPFLGLLGDRFGVLRALAVVVMMLAVAAGLSGALVPPPAEHEATVPRTQAPG